MATRCKVTCIMTRESISYIQDTTGKSVPKTVQESQFTAVVGGSDENKQFFQYTPTLALMVGTVKNPTFVAGKNYYLDFIEAEE